MAPAIQAAATVSPVPVASEGKAGKALSADSSASHFAQRMKLENAVLQAALNRRGSGIGGGGKGGKGGQGGQGGKGGKGGGGYESTTCGDFNARWGCVRGTCLYGHVCRACGSRAHGEWACFVGRGDRAQCGGDGGRERSRDRGNGR